VIDARAAPGAAADAAAARRLGALLRAQQMAGALERILEISLDYARNRVQFGRPIARFQAVQQELARLAGECAAAAAAAGAGASALARHGLAHEIAARAAAAAKIRVGQAAGAGAAIAHQVHGAMGFSQEYVLQRYTRQLWSWRDDFGAETEWAQWLGQRVCAAGAEGLWPELTRA
jgi:alkylation response protein AidB-like acyl-CoA dehydrogenase